MWEWLKKLFGCGAKEEEVTPSEMPEQASEPQAEEETDEDQQSTQ